MQATIAAKSPALLDRVAKPAAALSVLVLLGAAAVVSVDFVLPVEVLAAAGVAVVMVDSVLELELEVVVLAGRLVVDVLLP